MDWGGDSGSIVRSIQAARAEDERRRLGIRRAEQAASETRPLPARPAPAAAPDTAPAPGGEPVPADANRDGGGEEPKPVVRTINI
jgi:hypothetical protein